jgi:hypothetical protein
MPTAPTRPTPCGRCRLRSARRSGRPAAHYFGGSRPVRARHDAFGSARWPRRWAGPADGEPLPSIVAVSEIARFRFSFAPAYRLPAQAFGISPANGLGRCGRPGARCPFRSVAGLNAARERHRCRGDWAVRILEDRGARAPRDPDRGLTFATNGDRGVLISFRLPCVASIDWESSGILS